MIQLPSTKTRNKNTFTISELKGVDAWNNPLSVSPDRAVVMRNIVNRNGLNHKRYGWAQDGASFDGAIDGYYKATFYDKTWEIIYAGHSFYVKIDGILSKNVYSSSLLTENPTKFYFHDGKVFITGCGDYLVFEPSRNGYFSFSRVADSKHAYVPLTFISDYYGSDRGLAVVAGEKSNMLSSWRINKFYDADCAAATRSYRLDVYNDKPTTTPVIDEIGSVDVSWIDPDRGETAFSVIENGEAYRVIAANDEKKSDNGWYEFTYKNTKYYLQAKASDTAKTIIGLVIHNGTISTLDFRTWKLRSSLPSEMPPLYDATLIKTGFVSSRILADFDITGYKLTFSGSGECSTLRNHTEWEYRVGTIKKIYWVAHSSDWDQCFLTDGTYTYAMAARGNWLSKYTYYAGASAANQYPDGFSGESHTYASEFIFPEGSRFVSLEKNCGEILYDANGEVAERFCNGYTLAYSSDGTVKHAGVICPYSGELSFIRYVTETWDGIGDEKIPTISVKFKTKNSESAKISKCTVSTLFGLNGNSDRLFLGGNPDYPNVDWHSGYTDKDGKGGNFGYFPSDSSAVLGTAKAAIKGYQRLSDGTLAVYKEKSNDEVTLYLRSGVSETDSDGRIIEYYPNNGGYVTEGAINSECFGVLGKDMLMLSENGVFGLEIDDNVASQQRFLKERSKPVNSLLKKHNSLKNARAVVFDNKYFLAVDDTVYVADGRYTRKERGDMSDTFSYEWYVWDNCSVRTWITDGDRLGFGTDDGRICFFGDGFSDIMFMNIKYPNIGFNREDFGTSGFVINAEIKFPSPVVVDGREYNKAIFKNVLGGILGRWAFTFSSYELVARYAEDNATGRGNAERYIREFIKEGDYVYFTSDYYGTCTGKRRVMSVDYDALEIHMQHTVGEKWMVAATGERYTEAQKPPNVDFILVDIGEGYVCPRQNVYGKFFYASKLIGLSFSGVWFNAEELAKSTPDIGVSVYGEVPVTAFWQTGALNFGTNFYVKQIESVSTLTEGHMKVSFETRTDNGYSIEIANAGKPFDFGDLGFGEVNFTNLMDDENGVLPFTRPVKKTFGTLVLRIENNAANDFVIHEITFIYKLLRKLKGVR